MNSVQVRLRQIIFSIILVLLPICEGGNIVSAEIFMSISGSVNDTSTGKAISGVEVMATGSNNKNNFSVITDKSGKYSIAMVPVGEYTLSVQPPAVYIFKPYTKKVKVEQGRNVVALDFWLPLGGALEGRIYMSDGVTPLANASIYALTNKGVSMASTNSTGKYLLMGLEPESSAKVRIIVYGYGMVIKDNLSINAGQITPNIDILLPSSISGITGMISTNSSVGMPIENVFVVMKGDNGFGIAKSDLNGNYMIYGLPAGSYEVTVYKIGFARKQMKNVVVTEGLLTNYNYVLMAQPLPQMTEINQSEQMNIISLPFNIDNPEFSTVGIQATNDGHCLCASFSFSGVPIFGIALLHASCRCSQPCGKINCITYKTVNSLCGCLGLGASASLASFQYCDSLPETGVPENWVIDLPVNNPGDWFKWPPKPGLGFGLAGDCGGPNLGTGLPGLYYCSCAQSVE